MTLKGVIYLLVGTALAVALMLAAIALWARNLIIFAAPVGVASLAAAWVTIDNLFVYRRPPAEPPVESTGQDTGA